MTIAQTVALVSAIIAILGVIIRLLFKAHSLYLHQAEQDKRIDENKEELGIICECIFATLDGLEQLGCNHSVPAAKKKMQSHLNKKAHE